MRIPSTEAVVARLRAAGCVFAEDEADLLVDAARDAVGLESMLRRRTAGEPLEHIVGWVDFHGLRLRVGPGVFVPRQRSVHLASVAVAESRRRPGALMLEVCCGVGPIAASVSSQLGDATVLASDNDPVCLAYARLNLPTGATYLGDLFEPVPHELRSQVDVVAAVAPYVPSGAVSQLPREARDHEPTAALAAGDDGLDVIRRIVEQAGGWLAADGVLLLEMHATQASVTTVLAQAEGFWARVIASDDGHTVVVRASPQSRRDVN